MGILSNERAANLNSYCVRHRASRELLAALFVAMAMSSDPPRGHLGGKETRPVSASPHDHMGILGMPAVRIYFCK